VRGTSGFLLPRSAPEKHDRRASEDNAKHCVPKRPAGTMHSVACYYRANREHARRVCDPVLSSVAGWSTPNPNDFEQLLPNSSSGKNFATCVVVDFAAARKRPEQRAAGKRLDPRERAAEWLRQLEAREWRPAQL
jgi:hypothetical protein